MVRVRLLLRVVGSVVSLQARHPSVGFLLLRDRKDVYNKGTVCGLYTVDSEVKGVNREDCQPYCQG